MNFNPSQTFNFLPLPTDVHFGFGVVHTVGERVRALGGRKVLLVTDPGVRRAGLADIVMSALKSAAVEVVVFDGVTADSGSTLIGEVTEAARADQTDVVVGLGGGSALDTAKAAAALLTNPGSALDYVGLHRLAERPRPMIAIPTTSGTGSEVSLWSVFTDDTNQRKVAIGGVWIYPAVALCDPELTLGLPRDLTAATGVDALAHAIECYTNDACQPISAALAFQAIALIGRHLRTAALNGRDRASRYAMMLASTMAGMAMNPTRLGLAHALAMPLGSGSLKIPHGLAVAVPLPRVMAFNALAMPERFIAVAQALGEPPSSAAAHEASGVAARAVERLCRDIGIPAGLEELGLRDRDVAGIVKDAMTSGNVAVNPRQTTQQDLEDILRRSL